MSTPKTIDMSRPTALYLSYIGILLFFVFIDTRVSLATFFPFLHIPFQQYLASGLVLISVALGLLGASRHSARTAEPWRVPQSQVFLCFALFFIFGLASVVISR